MIAHLFSEQLSECLLSQPSPIVARHIQDCPVCRAELASFGEALGEFRGAVRAWSNERASAALTIPPTSQSHVPGPLRTNWDGLC
jgi:hypothetical protein